MEEVFLKLVNMSIAASWLIIAVIVLRLLLKKAPKSITLALWAIVAVRLVCPISFESVLSLIPSAQTIPPEFVYSPSPTIHSGIPALNSAVNPIISESLAPSELASANPAQILSFFAAIVWLVGIAAMLIYAAISYIRLHRKVRESIPDGDGIWICDRISAPFILGIFCPRIYLPSSLNEQDKTYVLAHEQAHIRRRDYISKPLGFLLLSVYWFNPTIWIAYILFCKDIELCCDERVIKMLGSDSKKPYANALINCSTKRHFVSACPLAFGEVSVKSRIKSVLNYKKPAFWLIIAAIVVCAVTAVCFLTNPPEAKVATTGKAVANTYGYKTASGEYSPIFTLNPEDNTFKISSSWSTTLIESGTYEQNGNTLTLIINDLDGMDCKVVFKVKRSLFGVKEDKYIYNAKESDKVSFFSYDNDTDEAIPDGAIFEPFVLEDENNAAQGSTVYEYKSSADPTAPSITLKDDGTFTFIYSSLSSYFATGKYELSSDTLTLKADDGKSVYIFNKKDDKYIFDATKSSKIPELKYSDDSTPESPVPDGAVFEPKATNENIYAKVYSDKAFAFGMKYYSIPITDTTLREINLHDQDPNIYGENGGINKDSETYIAYYRQYSRKYKLYSEGKYLGEFDGKLGVGNLEGSIIDVNFSNSDKINANHFIAVADDTNIYPHPVSMSNTYSNSALISQMSKELKRTVKPIKNVACDIDNDGKDENIVTVTDGKDITAATLIDNDRIVSYISIYSLIGIYEKEYENVELDTELPIELADTNGDGITEIYCFLQGYEWVDGMVYTYENGKLHSNSTGYDQETKYKNYCCIAPPGFEYDK